MSFFKEGKFTERPEFNNPSAKMDEKEVGSEVRAKSYFHFLYS